MPRIKQKNSSIGFISDLHNNKELLKKSIKYYIQNPVDAIILGGDIPGYNFRSYKTILNQILKLKIPLIVFPGSHENGEIYERIMNYFKEEKLIIDGVKKSNRLIQYDNWEFILIPGSSSVSSAPTKFNGGSFWLFKEKITSAMKKKADEKLRKLGFARKSSLISIQDTINIINKKSKTKGSKKIIFSHEPLLCKTKNGIDIAQFGLVKKDFKILSKHKRLKIFKEMNTKGVTDWNKDNITTLDKAKILKKYNYPIKIMKKHVGNEDIRKLINKKNIKKLICGHIHECSRRAINKKEEKIKPKINTSELFLNGGINTITKINFNKNKINYEFM